MTKSVNVVRQKAAERMHEQRVDIVLKQNSFVSLSLINHCNFMMALRNTCSLSYISLFYHHTDLVLDSFRSEKMRGSLIDKVLWEAAHVLPFTCTATWFDFSLSTFAVQVWHIFRPRYFWGSLKVSALSDFLAASRNIYSGLLWKPCLGTMLCLNQVLICAPSKRKKYYSVQRMSTIQILRPDIDWNDDDRVNALYSPFRSRGKHIFLFVSLFKVPS